jgi:hypothetical protein
MSRLMTAIATIATIASLTSAAHAQTASSNLKANTSTGAEALQGLEARTFEFRNSPEEVRIDPYVEPRDAALNRTATLAPLDDQADLVLRVQESPIEPGIFPVDELRGYEQVQVLFQVQ